MAKETDIYEKLLTLMQEDAARGLRNLFIDKFRGALRDYAEQNLAQLAEDIEPYLKYSILGMFSAARKVQQFKQAVLAFFDKAEVSILASLEGYYNARRNLLCEMFRESHPDCCFPELPVIWMEYTEEKALWSDLPDSEWCEMYTWSLTGGMFATSRAAAEATVKNCILPRLPHLPMDHATLMEQTIGLWGKSAREVFDARRLLLINQVLQPALTELENELKGEEQWKNQAPVEYKINAILMEPSVGKYRTLIERVCRELDKLASALPSFSEPRLARQFKTDEFVSRMGQDVVDADDFTRRFINILKTELMNINHYYQFISSR